MHAVAFLRNVNQGQRGHPSSADVFASFVDAGAVAPQAFQSNGTVVFDADDPQAVLGGALAHLAARSGLERDGFWMPLARVAEIVDRHATRPDAHRCELTLHGDGVIDPTDPAVIAVARHRRCEIVDAGPGWLVCVNERDAESNATPIAERVTGGPASSRGLPTLVRLVDRFASAG